jgi:hypothetical protein
LKSLERKVGLAAQDPSLTAYGATDHVFDVVYTALELFLTQFQEGPRNHFGVHV